MKVRIVAAVVDTRRVILYKEDGKTITLAQGHPLIESIVKAVMPLVNRGGVAEIELDLDNPYRDFEEQSGGLVRIFKAAKSKLTGLFVSDDISPGVYGEIPDENLKLTSAIDEIIAHAQPVNADDFSPADVQEQHTLVAVVDNAKGERRAIPGVEKLAGQFKHATKDKNTKGLNALFERMAGYIDQRQHSVEDLLRFLENGDLPIADDGSILAYKRLYRVAGKPGYFCDPHTRRVNQRVGSFVCVAESLVDKNRRNECSNGLHIGRRQYMGLFNGDAIVLCKIAPEDVIVVPHNDPNKVRVCGYHIIAELNEDAFNTIKNNRPMTTEKGLGQLLAQAVAGNHIARIERVEITQQSGRGVVVTPLIGGKRAKVAIRKGAEKLAAPVVKEAVALDDPTMIEPERPPSSVDPRQVATDVDKAVTGSRQQRARQLLDIVDTSKDPRHVWQAAKDLMAFKKKVKISWDRLGVTDYDATKVARIANNPPAKPVAEPKPKKVVKAKDVQALPKVSTPLTKTQQARMLADQLESPDLNPAQQAVVARQMLDFRRQSKKSWESYGIEMSDERLKKIVNAAPADVPHTPVAVAPEPAAPAPAPAKPNTKPRKVKGGFVQLTAEPTGSTFDTDPAELALSSNHKAALALVRGGTSVSAASKQTGVHRRSIDRLIERFGK